MIGQSHIKGDWPLVFMTGWLPNYYNSHLKAQTSVIWKIVLSVCALHFLVHGSDVEEEWVFNKEVQLNQYKGPPVKRENLT